MAEDWNNTRASCGQGPGPCGQHLRVSKYVSLALFGIEGKIRLTEAEISQVEGSPGEKAGDSRQVNEPAKVSEIK